MPELSSGQIAFIKKVASELRLDNIEVCVTEEGEAMAYCDFDANRYGIVISPYHDPSTIAHELGHIFLGKYYHPIFCAVRVNPDQTSSLFKRQNKIFFNTLNMVADLFVNYTMSRLYDWYAVILCNSVLIATYKLWKGESKSQKPFSTYNVEDYSLFAEVNYAIATGDIESLGYNGRRIMELISKPSLEFFIEVCKIFSLDVKLEGTGVRVCEITKKEGDRPGVKEKTIELE